MNRRQLIERSTTLVAVASSALWAGASAAADKKAAAKAVAPAAPAASMDPHHHHMMSGTGGGAHEACMPGRFTALVAPFQACTATVAVCIAHCQVMLADGDKGMGPCLRTALDCDVTCNAVLRAATLNSDFTPALAQTAILAMEACVKACKPHVDHHAECRDCHDACLAAIAAARKLAA
jgi:Cys-rich four helix bundle protein (predicted Tat secretion target)